MNIVTPMVPFLKWPGGKRWFVANHSAFLPTEFNRYIEPFLGSGAVYFSLKPRRAVLGDINPDLIAVYKAIKEDWARVRQALEGHRRQHGKRYYYRIRGSQPRSPVHRAAQFIYLNRTCFNGIYRVNLEGHFNVPKGKKETVIFPTDDFQSVARLLSRTRLMVSDFEPLIDEAQQGDLVFADPPYTVRHNNNAFIRYNEALFSWVDQVRLARALERAQKRGATVVSTNANHRCVRELYDRRGFVLKKVSRFSPISAASDSRGQFEELVICSKENGATA